MTVPRFFSPPPPPPVTSRHVVRSPLGTMFRGPWPTVDSAFAFAASFGGADADVIAARIEPAEPYAY